MSTVGEVLKFVKENDVKFVKLAFCDLFGFLKNVAIVSEELSAAFENGVSFDAHSIKGFRDATDSDLFLFPDPTTLTVLPWRPGPGRVVRFFCDVQNPDGTIFPCDSRNLLKIVEKRCEKMGYACKIGAECEFYLFKTDELGEPTQTTLDGGEYLDIAPLDKGENIRREICLTLEEMGINPETSYHERGPGQNEIDFKFNSPLKCADNFMTFKAVVKAIALRNGLFASFMPKPIQEAPGNGMHIGISLIQNGVNIFKNIGDGSAKVAESFIAGILSKTPEITTFLNPLLNSFDRLGEFEAPKFVSWSRQNHSQLVRILAPGGEKTRMELRSPDPSLNPYLAFSLIISAGLDGIEEKLALCEPLNMDLSSTDKNAIKNLRRLPENLDKAIDLTEESKFVKKVVGENLLSKYIGVKKDEILAFAEACRCKGESCDRYEGDVCENTCRGKTEFYRTKYFNTM
jgi:glutamine synthetase